MAQLTSIAKELGSRAWRLFDLRSPGGSCPPLMPPSGTAENPPPRLATVRSWPILRTVATRGRGFSAANARVSAATPVTVIRTVVHGVGPLAALGWRTLVFHREAARSRCDALGRPPGASCEFPPPAETLAEVMASDFTAACLHPRHRPIQ